MNTDKLQIVDEWMYPTPEYPHGSWLHKVGGDVYIATGYFATIYPDKPSPYFHGGPPFVVLDTAALGWDKK